MSPVAPPSDEAAEMAVLGSVLLDPAALADIGHLAPEAFYWGRHQHLWRVMVALDAAGTPPDALLVYREVERRGLVEAAGGRDYIATLSAAVTSPVHAPHYAKAVREKAHARALIRVAQTLEAEARAGENPATCHKTAQEALYGISSLDGPAGAFHLSDALYAVLGGLMGGQPDGLVLPTGYPALDDLLAGGLRGGQMVVVAGRPGMGKTTWALNVVGNAAKAGRTALAFTLEQTAPELARAMLANEAGVDSARLRKGRDYLGGDGMDRVSAAATALGNRAIWVSDSSAASVASIRAEAMKRKGKDGLDLLVVDYLQLMEGDQTGSRQEDVSRMSRGLKLLAKDLKVPVMALAQLNRMVEQREGHRPKLADLRESGAVEQDADVVLFLHRPYLYSRSEQDRNGAEVIVAKNRNGPVGDVRLFFDPALGRFREPLAADFT